MYEKDRRIVITLDAGGTNFVFGAVQGDRFVVEPITLPSNSDRLDRCLETMVEGFRTVISRLPEQPVAISFAFPGPADYPRGIIGGYLPSTAGNEYQGQHYHGALEVTAQQADLGPYDHNETGEDPAEFVVNVPVQIADQSDPLNPDYLVGVESIPMTFDKDTTTASATEIIRQLREFLAKNLIEGKQWTLYGTIPAEFAIVNDEDTGVQNAVFGGNVHFLLVSLLPA